jgi:hypothetical protein
MKKSLPLQLAQTVSIIPPEVLKEIYEGELPKEVLNRLRFISSLRVEAKTIWRQGDYPDLDVSNT